MLGSIIKIAIITAGALATSLAYDQWRHMPEEKKTKVKEVAKDVVPMFIGASVTAAVMYYLDRDSKDVEYETGSLKVEVPKALSEHVTRPLRDAGVVSADWDADGYHWSLTEL